MSKESREITSADQLMLGKTYFIEQGDFIGCATFQETKSLAYFDKLTRIFNDRYELFKACKDENVRIYEGVSNLEIKEK